MPRRIQFRRTKGWRKPAGAVSVARPTRWGNPLHVARKAGRGAAAHAVSQYYGLLLFRDFPEFTVPTIDEIRKHLRGRDLACWCPLDWPCHADVLLRIANG